ncbi:MAG: hypothetical protein HQL54_14690 [Magnetococcales bacterium]|nr:hypothetical protein [Magnetococcales bacterium]
MNMFWEKRKRGGGMRWAIILLFGLALLPVDLWASNVILQENHFTIRKVDKVCKLDVAFSMKDLEGGANQSQNVNGMVSILGLFSKGEFFGELFTRRDVIGLARKKVQIQFDRAKPLTINFVPGSDSKDQYWRWQYLEETRGLLDNIARKNTMRVSFSNGNENWKFKIGLKGTAKIVRTLRRCGR